MSVIAAAYSSYTSWSISQSGTAAANADTGSTFGTASSTASSASVTTATTVTISYRAKLLLARASSEQSVADRLQAQVDAFRSDRSASALRGIGAGGDLSGGLDFFRIIAGAGNDSITVQANNATIDAGAGDDVVDTYRNANVVAGDGDDVAPSVIAVALPVSASAAPVPDCEIDQVVYDE